MVDAFNSIADSLNSQAKEVTNLIGALSESEQRYRILFESAVEGILVTEIKTKKFKYANPALCEILGYTEKGFEQMTLFDIHPKDNLEFAVSQFETMAKGGKILTSDVPCCRKDGTIIYADIKGTKILVDQAECILGHFTDITSRRLAEDENRKLQLRLQRAEKMEALGVLAGGVAHDLNNVLCGLVSYPEFLLLDLPVTRKEIEKGHADISIEKLLGKGEKILVIDDVWEQRDIASMLLTKLGYSVTTVSSGEKAVAYMKTESADLLILDMIMDPGIDGLQTYKDIPELHPGQKAIIASGFSETDRVKEAHKLGAGQYVREPYALKQLEMAVKTELQKQSLQVSSANHPGLNTDSNVCYS